jgi:hypothetical protein
MHRDLADVGNAALQTLSRKHLILASAYKIASDLTLLNNCRSFQVYIVLVG